MSTLIVTLPTSQPSATTPCNTVLVGNDGNIQSHGQTPIALFPDMASGEIVALVPAAQLSWHQLILPKGSLGRGLFQDGSTARLRAVLDGLLEDRLLDEPELLHFAIAPTARDAAPVWVAACNRAWLQGWLQALEQAGKPIARVVPELSPQEANTNMPMSVSVTGSEDAPQMLCSSQHGVDILPLHAPSIGLLGTDAHPDSTPGVEVDAEPAVATSAEEFFPGRVRLLTEAQRAQRAAQSGWDLAQFDFLRTRRARTQKRLSGWASTLWHAPQWRPARWAFGALLLVNVLGLQAWAWKEQSALAAKKTAVRDILTSTFSDVRVVVDAPLQMERSFANLQRQSGAASGGDLESMLGHFQALAPELPTPDAIEFAANELRLGIPGLLPGQVPAIASRMQGMGYIVTMHEGQLRIKYDTNQAPRP